jgi:hypothetical protein
MQPKEPLLGCKDGGHGKNYTLPDTILSLVARIGGEDGKKHTRHKLGSWCPEKLRTKRSIRAKNLKTASVGRVHILGM